MSEYKVELEWLKDSSSPYKRMAKLGNKDDKLPDLICVTPPEFKKGIPNYWSPEHLFVSSVVACFFTTFLAISDSSGLPLKLFTLKGTGILEKDARGKEAIIRIDLYPLIVVENEMDLDKAKKIAEKTEANCLIANSMKSVIMLHPSIKKS